MSSTWFLTMCCSFAYNKMSLTEPSKMGLKENTEVFEA